MDAHEEEEYDPKVHKKEETPVKLALKLMAIIGLCLGVVIAIRVQKGIIKEEVTTTEITTTTQEDGMITTIETEPAEPNLEQGGQEVETRSNEIQAAKTSSLEETITTPGPSYPFSKEKPILVLSLPHNADLAISRYFKCAGVNQQEIGKYWSRPDSSTTPLGLCMLQNIRDAAANGGATTTPITHHCGYEMSVLSELHFVEAARTKGHTNVHAARCFDPVLYPNALEKLYEAIPNAYVITVQQDPLDWYQLLPKDIKAHWKTWCNPTHNTTFPTSSRAIDQYITFYRNYYSKLDNFIQQHTNGGWESIQIDLRVPDQDTTATYLEERLQISAKCWMESIDSQAQLEVGANVNGEPPIPPLHQQKRPNTIRYPILSVSLPLLGFAHNYFQCGLGYWAVSHQWTTPSKSTTTKPVADIPIGQCIQNNWNSGTTNVLKGCGHNRVWSDIGYLRDSTGICFYPTLQEGVLEKFAAYYPHATILHTVYESPLAWYRNAQNKNNLPNRWSAASRCQGFPPTGSTVDDWQDFYVQHLQAIRQFAARHTNLTYIEVPYSERGGEILQDVFQFPQRCWPKIED